MQLSEYAGLSALVIDDFDNFRTTLSRLLQDFGIKKVHMAHTGEEAIRHCNVHTFDLVLCDYNLGNGKNGQQVLEELRIKSLLPSSSIFLLISAETSKSIVMSAYDYEPDGYLTKPITAKALQQRIVRLLTQRVDMADCYRALDDNRLDDVVSIAEVALAQGSRHAGAYQKLLGQVYLRQHNLDGAESLFRQVLEARSLDWAQVGLAQVQRARGNTETAEKWLRSIIAKSAFCMNAYDELAGVYQDQGKSAEQQSVLQASVDISPMSISRQAALGEVAALNNDLEVAARAFGRTVRLGRNSCLDSADNHLAFIRSVTSLASEDKARGEEYVRDVQRTLAECGKRFILSEDMQMQLQLLEASNQALFGDKGKAASLLQKLQVQIDQVEVLPSLDVRLDLVQALRANNDQAKAKVILDQLVIEYAGDELSLRKIDRLLAEPASESNRARVAAINSAGIKAYKSGDFQAAIASFEEAQKLFPHHVGVQLNLAQAFIGGMKKFGKSEERLASSRDLLDKIRAGIDHASAQFERYQHLDSMLRQLLQEKE